MNLRQILNIASLILMLALNGLANALPLNGVTTGEVSDGFPVLFTPAGYVFSIWGLIYLLLIAFAVYQALPAQRDNPRLARAGYWFVTGNLINSAWIFLWHYGFFPLTMIATTGLLISLLAVYLNLRIGVDKVPAREKLFVDVPFSVYLGWASVATIANAAVFLYDLGWNGGGLGPLPWTLLMILVAAVLGVMMIRLRREVAYPLVLVWAFAGIAVRQSEVLPVMVVSAVAALAILAFLLFDRLPNLRAARQMPS